MSRFVLMIALGEVNVSMEYVNVLLNGQEKIAVNPTALLEVSFVMANASVFRDTLVRDVRTNSLTAVEMESFGMENVCVFQSGLVLTVQFL